MTVYKASTPERAGYTRPNVKYRGTSAVMRHWGDGTTTPPASKIQRRKLTPFTFWDGTKMPGGIHRDLIPAVQAMDDILRKYSYRLDGVGDDWCYNRRPVRGGKSWSSHSWGAALDINAQQNPFSTKFRSDMPPPMVAEIEALRTRSGHPVWRWGGWFRRKVRGRWRGKWDAMHFQAACTPAELATGITGKSSRPPTNTPLPPPTSKEDDVTPAFARLVFEPALERTYIKIRGSAIDPSGAAHWPAAFEQLLAGGEDPQRATIRIINMVTEGLLLEKLK